MKQPLTPPPTDSRPSQLKVVPPDAGLSDSGEALPAAPENPRGAPVLITVLVIAIFHFVLGFGRPIWAISGAHSQTIDHVEIPGRAARFFATTDIAGEIHIWHSAERRRALAIKSPKAPVLSLSFSPQEDRLAFLDGDGALHLWHLLDGKEQLTVPGPFEEVKFSPDGNKIALRTPSGEVRFFLAQQRRFWPPLDRALTAFEFCHNGAYLGGADLNGAVSIWQLSGINLQSPRLVGTIPPGENGAQSPFLALKFSDQLHFVAAMDESSVHVWEFIVGNNALSLKPVKSITPDLPIRQFDICESEDLVVMAFAHDYYEYYQLETGRFTHFLNPKGYIRNRWMKGESEGKPGVEAVRLKGSRGGLAITANGKDLHIRSLSNGD